MRSFDELWEIAAKRKGGVSALEQLLHKPKPIAELEKIPASEILATFSGGVFATGLATSVIEKKWPDILEAYHGFDLNWCASIVDERFDALLSDPRVIRHGAKIAAVQENASWLLSLENSHPSSAHFFANWPKEDFASLLLEMKDKGARLGGNVGAYSLRRLGFDSYILTRDVVARLIAEGVVDKAPSSKTAMKAVQSAFNAWREQSGRSLSEISRVLALSVGV